MTTHRIGRAIAVASIAALAACSGRPASAPALASSRSALTVVPPDTSFHAFLCSGTVKGDPAGDQTTGGAWRDIVGDVGHPAFYRAADAQNIYFRMRVSGDPRKPGSTTELQPSSWDVLVDTDGDLRTYEYMFTADGNLPGGNAVQLVRNSVQEPTDPTDPARDDKTADLIADLTPAVDYWSVKVATDGSSFGGDPDYFITLVLPKLWLTQVGVDLTKDFVVWAGTNARTYSLNSDFGCFVGIPTNLGDAGNDPGDLDPPVANDDSVTTPEDTPIVIDVLANDTGIELGTEAEPCSETVPCTAVAIESQPAHGSIILGADRTITYSPAPDWFGVDTFTYRVTDTRANGQAGETDTAVVTVTVTPVDDAPPVAVDDAWTMVQGTTSTIDVLANDTVIDGVVSLTILTPPLSGAAVVNPDRTISYTADASFAGTVTFVYEVTDTDGQTDTATVTVTVRLPDSGFPVARADSAETDEDVLVTIPVLANDTVLDLPAVVTLATEPAHGTVTVNGDRIDYMPAPDYFGPDFFTYQVTDYDGQSATATVSITVTPVDDGPPIAVEDAATTPEDTAVGVAVLANDTVKDGPGAVTIATPPAHGTAVVNADGSITYTPAAGFYGVDELVYQLTDRDDQAARAPVSIRVTPVDSGAPVAVDDAFTTAEDTALPSLPVLANDTVLDPPAVVTLVTGPAHGTATVNADGTIAYTPGANYFGQDAFTYQVADLDGQAASARVSITVTPVNDASPVAAADSATTPEGTAVDVPVLANDVVTDGVSAVAILTPPAHGAAGVNADGTITYTPAASYFGQDSFTYQVTDSDGQAASAQVTLTVTPVDSGAPMATPDAFTTVEDTALPSLVVLANDVVLDEPAIVSLATPPVHGTATVNVDGTIAYAPAPDYAGPDVFSYRVTDRDGQSDTATVSIVVTPVGDAPVANPDAATAHAAWPPVVIPVLANDADADGDALSVTSATQGAHGIVTVLPDGTIQYLAAADFVGVDTFTYVVSDGTATDSTTVTVTVTPPLDSDGDGIPDYLEDTNHDGTVDPGETDPGNPDTDGDGLPDGIEDANHDGTVDPGETDPGNPDTDGDGLPDGIEDANHNGTVDPGETDPLNPDTDGDGLPDGVEDSNHNGTVDPGETDPRNPDTNGDGILDGIGVRGGGCASGPGGAASLLLVGMALVLRRRGLRPARR